ncbi:MAG: adenylyltransferase/cytidyltransferase family protein [Polyangiaceae bacterium]|nr:adenylyltransferase/cytidyltransferase family protein [Polyangiaceae bacterium]
MSYLDKIRDRAQLASVVASARATGKVVVQCHGCFDILHPGHLRHLTWARQSGDLLVVTVSADRVVMKGRSRPFVPERLRAEGLAALEVVDYVAIDDEEWAGPALELLRPDVYVKGKEFEDVFDGRFGRERRVVESYGGRVLFSSGDVVYSSTRIIEGHRDSLEPTGEQVISYCRRHGIDRSRLADTLRRMAGKRVVVVGETVVDRYVHTDPLGMSAEAPVLVVRPRETETFIGGAAIVAQHVHGLGATSRLLSFVGRDAAGDGVRRALEARGLETVLLDDPSRPTIEKTRYVSDGKKLLNVNVFHDHDLDTATERALLERLEQAADWAEAVVMMDFGYGVLTDAVVEWGRRVRRERGIPVLGDVQCSTQLGNVRRMKGVTLIAPSEREARLSLCDRKSGIADLGARLLLDTLVDAVVITLGARGMMLIAPTDEPVSGLAGMHPVAVKQRLLIEYLPTLVGHPVDPVGAGDAMLATLAAALAADASVPLAALAAMGAAAVEVSLPGNVPVQREQVSSALAAYVPD